MAPRKTGLVRQYFRSVFKGPKQTPHSLCLANKHDKLGHGEYEKYGIEKNDEQLQCQRILAGEKVSNMKTHLRSAHPQIFQQYLLREQEPTKDIDFTIFYPDETQSSSAASASSLSHLPGGRVGKKKLENKITSCGILKRTRASISVSKALLIRALLSKVTVEGRPFSSLHDLSFSTFSVPAMKALNVHYDHENIGELVSQAAEYIKRKLKTDMNNSLVCVKVDCVTRMKRSFIGINLQLVKNGEIVVYTLAAREITVRLTSDNLKKIILEELETVGILPKHIYTITSDNGANFVKAVELIEEEQLENIRELMEDDEDIAINDDLMEMIADASWESEGIKSFRCAAHVLHSCIADTLKNSWCDEEVSDVQNTYLGVIDKARKVVAELRTQNVAILLSDQKLKRLSVDVPFRWTSTYLMLNDLVPLKEFCVSCARLGNLKLQLTDDEWTKIEEIRLCLEPSYHATKKLQYPNNTLTDVYKIWNMCHMKTAEIGSPFASELVFHMTKRRDALMENVIMLSALYLDPRFSFELSKEQKQKAVKHICLVQSRMAELLHEQKTELSSDTDILSDDDEDDKYEKLLKKKHRHQKQQEMANRPNFEDTLISFSAVERMPHTTNVLKFWHEEHSYSLLSGVVCIILSVPGTQVSVEQLYSQLKFIYDLRGCLTFENIDNLLIVRCNFELLDDFFDSEL